MKKDFENWEVYTDILAQSFVEHYFGEGAEVWWIGDKIGGILVVNDYFFSLDDIADFIRHKYTKKEMFDYYDYRLKRQEKNKSVISIDNWKKIYAKKRTT